MRSPSGGPRRRAAETSVVGLTAAVLVGSVLVSAAVAAPDPSADRFSLHQAGDGYAFSTPAAMASYGGNLFVVNRGGNTVTELNASTGTWVRTIPTVVGKFSTPTAIVGLGVDLFVANRAGSVSEIDARTGSLVRLITGSTYGFSSPTALAVHGTDLLVLNAGGSVTEIDGTSGLHVRTIAGAGYGFNHPSAIVVAGGQAWVTNNAGNSVTEFDATTGAWIRTLASSAYQLHGPSGIAFDGTKLWVADNATAQITVIVAATGALSGVFAAAAPGPAPVVAGDVRVYVASPAGSSPMVTAYTAIGSTYQWMMCNSNGPYSFNNPQAMLVVGTELWVANTAGNSLTQMNAITGDYLQRIA